MFLFNLIHICFFLFFFRKQDEIPLQEMMLGVMMSSVKVGKSKKMCAVKKKKRKEEAGNMLLGRGERRDGDVSRGPKGKEDP